MCVFICTRCVRNKDNNNNNRKGKDATQLEALTGPCSIQNHTNKQHEKSKHM